MFKMMGKSEFDDFLVLFDVCKCPWRPCGPRRKFGREAQKLLIRDCESKLRAASDGDDMVALLAALSWSDGMENNTTNTIR